MASPDGQRVRCSAKAIEPQIDNTSANPIHAAEPPTLHAPSPANAMTTPHITLPSAIVGMLLPAGA